MGIANAVGRLSNFWIFAGLDAQTLDYIGTLFEERQAKKGDVLFAQGDVPDFFYLIEEGIVRERGVDDDGREVLRRIIGPGGFFGRWSLMHDRRRRATATVEKHARLLRLPAADFRSLLIMYPSLHDNLARTHVIARLLAIPLFRYFSDAQLSHVADLLTVVEYESGQTIFQPDGEADGFYVVDTGQVLVGDRYVTAGNFFGHEELLDRRASRRQQAVAQTDVRLFRFDLDAFWWLGELQHGFHREIEQFDIQKPLEQVPEFAGSTSEDRRYLAGYVGLARYRRGDILFHQGEFDPTLYFLYDGAVVTESFDPQTGQSTHRYLRAGTKGVGFGQGAMFLAEPRDATARATAETLLIYLHRADYGRLVAAWPAIEKHLALREEVKERKEFKPLPWMGEDEHILFRERRHWFVLVSRLLPVVLLLLLSLALALIPLAGGWQSALRCLRIGAVVLSLLWVLWRYVDWRNDYYTVTDQRAVHEEKILFIQETRHEAPLSKVQNVNVAKKFPGSWLGYGRLTIETAVRSGVSNLVFDHLGHPEDAQRRILEQTRRVQASEALETRRAIREKLRGSLGQELRPLVPKPVIPLPPRREMEESPPSVSLWQRLAEATWRKWFWIKKEEGDQITWRKHWLRLGWRVLLPSTALLLWSAVLVFLWLVAFRGGVNWGVMALWGIVFLGLAFWWWWRFENWGNDLYTVTTDRIIDIEAWPFGLRTKRTETMFDRVQNVSFDIPNPIATLFNLGTVIISTAGAEGTLNFEHVRDPKGIQSEIFRRLAAYEDQQRRRQQEAQWANLPDWFAEYDRLRRLPPVTEEPPTA